QQRLCAGGACQRAPSPSQGSTGTGRAGREPAADTCRSRGPRPASAASRLDGPARRAGKRCDPSLSRFGLNGDLGPGSQRFEQRGQVGDLSGTEDRFTRRMMPSTTVFQRDGPATGLLGRVKRLVGISLYEVYWLARPTEMATEAPPARLRRGSMHIKYRGS